MHARVLSPVVALLLVAGAASAQSAQPTSPLGELFPHVLASLELQPGQGGSVTVPDQYTAGPAAGAMTIHVPAGAFQDPVRFEVLAAPNASFASLVPNGVTVIANFAYRVTDLKTGALLTSFAAPASYTVSDTMVTKDSRYWAVHPSGESATLTDASAGSTIQGAVLSHPTPTAAVGWIVTTPTAQAMAGGASSSMSKAGGSAN